jgi:molybdenum cofactor cytidylyltransferase
MCGPRIAGVILATGMSRRLGRPKQLLPLAGRPALAHVIDAAAQTPLDPQLVILGYASDEIQAHVDCSSTVVVINADYAGGESTSVKAAIRALPPNVDAALFFLGDQPLVDHRVIERLIAAYRTQPAAILQPCYREGPGNPVMIARPLFPELLKLTGDTGARPLLYRYQGQIKLVEVPAVHRPEDLDTWEDYERLRAESVIEQARSDR